MRAYCKVLPLLDTVYVLVNNSNIEPMFLKLLKPAQDFLSREIG